MTSKLIKSLWTLTSSLIMLMCFLQCNNAEDFIESPVPSVIKISQNKIYELLPSNTQIGTLSTDLNDANTKFRLVSGDGDTDNDEFEITNTTLKTKSLLHYEDGERRSIRIKAFSGEETFEQSLSITIIDFKGAYPEIISGSFIHNEEMPAAFGADHGNVSPDLLLENIPFNTTAMVLTMIDLDDDNSVHWAAWNIPPDKSKIIRNQTWPDGVTIGNNSFGEGYIGPFPPSLHRYKISSYFLAEEIILDKTEFLMLESKMTGLLIAQSDIIGLYSPE